MNREIYLKDMSRYIKEYERYKIEAWLKAGVSKKEIAKNLNKCLTCIYNEIKRGTVELLGYDLIPYKTYSAEYAQTVHEKKSHNKGQNSKCKGQYEMLCYISDMICSQRLSPYAVTQVMKGTGFSFKPCVRTIYNYIYSGLVPGVTAECLAYKRKKKRQRKIAKIPVSYAEKTLIDERTADIDSRDAAGHWEMDTVYSGKNKNKACLLVLTERKTRKEMILKMKDRTAQATVNALDSLERRLGKRLFRKMFRSITCDNGVEFSDVKGITKNNRTVLYHCHAYASYERGSNENQNKLIRRFIKKGEDISKYTKRQIQDIEGWINMLPRKMFDGRSSEEVFSKYFPLASEKL